MTTALRHQDEWLSVWQGDNREVMRQLPEKSVHAVVTSPPFYGLRDYDLPPSVWGGDASHEHEWGEEAITRGPAQAQGATSARAGRSNVDEQVQRDRSNGAFCACGSWRGCLGLEPNPALYVDHLVEVFRDAWRVLRDDGILWLNLGDSYARSQDTNVPQTKNRSVPYPEVRHMSWSAVEGSSDGGVGRADRPGTRARSPGLKPKDLIGIPWMAAFALRADGWYLRQDIVWAKGNAMPESVEDRPTRSHEFIFQLTKRPTYFYDWIAVREPASEATLRAVASRAKSPIEDREYQHDAETRMGKRSPNRVWSDPAAMERLASGRNMRDVWTIPTAPYPGAHYAVFPRKLVEPMVKASTSEGGVCPECGAPWSRATERTSSPRDLSRPQAVRALELAEAAGLTEDHLAAIRSSGVTDAGKAQMTQDGYGRNTAEVQALAAEAKEALGGYYREFLLTSVETVGWEPSCAHYGRPVPATVLDCFAGSGTVGLVAQSLGRRAILIDLNAEYTDQQMLRNAQLPLSLL